MTRKYLPGLIASTICLLCSIQGTAQLARYTYGEGLELRSRDSSFHIEITGRIQTLFNSETELSDPRQVTEKLNIRRARLKSDGYLFTPRLAYKLEFGLSNRDRQVFRDTLNTAKMPNFILDAVLKFKLHKNLEIWAGQTKLPSNRERVVSSQNLQFVDRSRVNSIFNLDREFGFQFRGKIRSNDLVLRPIFSLSVGEVRSSFLNSLGGLHYSGRLEILPFGEFTNKGDYFESDLERESTPKIMIGLTYSYNDNAVRQSATRDYLVDEHGHYLKNDLVTFIADLVYKYKGMSFTAEFADKMVSNMPVVDGEFVTRDNLLDANGRSYHTGMGLNLQVAYLFNTNTEIATRWTRVTPDSKASFKATTEYTLGVSQYFKGHLLKIQSDISYTMPDGASDNILRYRLQAEIAF